MRRENIAKIVRRKTAANIPHSRWLAYAAAGTATAVAGMSTAEADIHYSGTLNSVFIAGYSATVTKSFALDNNAVLEFRQAGSSRSLAGGIAFFREFGAAVSNQFIGIVVGNFRYPSNLAAGVTVNNGAFAAFNGNNLATLAYSHGFAHSKFTTAGTGFIGFRFNNGTGTEYGWARVTVTGASANDFTLVDYAWGDVGTMIMAGQTAVPEPGTLGLLAAGAVGLVTWRRRRSKATAAEQNA